MASGRLSSMTAVLALSVLGLLGCRSNRASDAKIAHKPGSPLFAVEMGAMRAELPVGDIQQSDGAVPVVQDDTGRRLAYRTNGGMARILYVVGDALFIGPLVSSPVDFRAVPGVDHALGPLFEAAGSRRAELVREVRRERGETGVVRLLIEAAYVDDVAWEAARKTLPHEQQEILGNGLASGLEPGKAPILLRRAVAVIDIRAPSRAKLVAARARELADGTKEPRAAAVLLRALIATDRAKAVEIGCEVLAKRAAAPSDGSKNSLYEAATLAIAAADAACEERPKLLESFLDEACLPHYRCGEKGPVSWSDSSKQDEPLCTPAELERAIASELERTPQDVLESGATRPALWAYASLVGKDRVPGAFLAAHARRRYAVTQPAEPLCESSLAPGTACHCDEATVRLYACKQPAASSVHVGVCRFAVDDTQKAIKDVVATPAP